ncbi:hypothetical protein Tco_1099591, partial [Tanacetum coccineum]
MVIRQLIMERKKLKVVVLTKLSSRKCAQDVIKKDVWLSNVLSGYPDWNGTKMFDQKLMAAVCSEVMKMFKGKGVTDGSTANANQASSYMHY